MMYMVQGNVFAEILIDYIRSLSNPTRSLDNPSSPAIGSSKDICIRVETNSNPAVCLSSNISNTNARVEGCCPVDRFCPWKRCRESCLYSRISKSSPGRSHRGTKNHIDSTWAESLQPTGIRIEVVLGELQNRV